MERPEFVHGVSNLGDSCFTGLLGVITPIRQQFLEATAKILSAGIEAIKTLYQWW